MHRDLAEGNHSRILRSRMELAVAEVKKQRCYGICRAFATTALVGGIHTIVSPSRR
jgi:hypothetical protein